MPYLGMQVLIEGLALAAFGMIRDTTDKPLPKQILAHVMQDEARHVAFGRMALRDHYRQLTHAELREREEFVVEGCYLMRDRLRGAEVLENFGIPWTPSGSRRRSGTGWRRCGTPSKPGGAPAAEQRADQEPGARSRDFSTASITARAIGAASPPPLMSRRSSSASSTTTATATLGVRSRGP